MNLPLIPSDQARNAINDILVRPLWLGDNPIKHACLLQVIVGKGLVHAGPVIPNKKVALLPFMAVDVLRLLYFLHQFINQRLAVLRRHALKLLELSLVQIDRLVAGIWVRAD